jgi:hypothetical protein
MFVEGFKNVSCFIYKIYLDKCRNLRSMSYYKQYGRRMDNAVSRANLTGTTASKKTTYLMSFPFH